MSDSSKFSFAIILFDYWFIYNEISTDYLENSLKIDFISFFIMIYFYLHFCYHKKDITEKSMFIINLSRIFNTYFSDKIKIQQNFMKNK